MKPLRQVQPPALKIAFTSGMIEVKERVPDKFPEELGATSTVSNRTSIDCSNVCFPTEKHDDCHQQF